MEKIDIADNGDDQNGTSPNLKFKTKKNRKMTLPKRYLKSRWKHFLSQDKNGVLLVEGVSVHDLQKKYGTPLFVMIDEEIRHRTRSFIEAFDYHPFKMRYACKCNSNLEVMKIVREEGSELDASSVGEIILGLLADFSPEQINFTNLYKTKQDILFAASIGVSSITLDSLEELDKAIDVAEKMNRRIPILLRVNPMIKDGKYSTKHQQYGIPYNYVKKALKKIKDYPNLHLKGFHFHGSYAYNFRGYMLAVKKIVTLAKIAEEYGIKIDSIDLGGGFPVEAPKMFRPGKFFTPKEFADVFVPFFKRLCKKNNLENITLIFEPGKAIVANAGLAVMRVVSNKKLAQKELVITNASCYSMLPDVLISRAVYDILPASKMRTPRTRVYDITGCTCDCIDVIKKREHLPPLEEGDLLVVTDCGAYSSLMGSNFNSLKRPPTVMVDQHGKTKLVRRGDRFSEMFAPELDVLKVADPKELKRFYDLSRVSLDKLWGEKANKNESAKKKK